MGLGCFGCCTTRVYAVEPTKPLPPLPASPTQGPSFRRRDSSPSMRVAFSAVPDDKRSSKGSVLSQDEGFDVSVVVSRGDSFPLRVHADMTTKELHLAVAKLQGATPAEVRLVCASKVLVDGSQKLSEVQVVPGAVVQCVRTYSDPSID